MHARVASPEIAAVIILWRLCMRGPGRQAGVQDGILAARQVLDSGGGVVLGGGAVAVGALGELVATAVAAAAGRTWSSLRPSAERRAVGAAVDTALARSLEDATFPHVVSADDAWVAAVAGMWQPAFTPQVTAALVACLADSSTDAVAHFSQLARAALESSGCDLAELGRGFWVEEFLAKLPRHLFDTLNEASRQDARVRGLVNHLLLQRIDARARGVELASPAEFRQDIIVMLRRLDSWARTEQLPSFLPTPADMVALSRPVQVRRGIRSELVSDLAAGNKGTDAGSEYLLPAERSPRHDPPRPWADVAAEHRRLVVLADPGLGKSWLIRTETYRLCREALNCLERSLDAVIIPIPLRCDQLSSGEGHDLAEKAVACLIAQRLLPERSRAAMVAKVRAGQVALLLDALDELTPADNGPVRQVVRAWAEQLGDLASCVITSRISGYTGSPLPDACEVELQPFTDDDTAALVAASSLPPVGALRLLGLARDPAVAAMSRIPLFLALLCWLAAQLPDGTDLPKTRAQLFDRVLRLFLTRVHRSSDDPAAAPRDHIYVDALMEVLAPLAFTFATQPAGWTDLMPGGRLLEAIRRTGPAYTELGTPAEVLRMLSVDVGILVTAGDPSAGRSPSYLFFHRAATEYLVASHLATLAESAWLGVVEQHRWFDTDWAEVIPMLGECLDPGAARRLIEYLLEGDTDPYHHSLLTAARVWGSRPDSDHLLTPGTAAKIVAQLNELLRHHKTRPAVISCLAKMPYLPRPLRKSVLDLLADPPRYALPDLVQALANMAGPEVTQALLGLVTDSDEVVRQLAARGLATREGPQVTQALLGLLSDPDKWVLEEAAKALAIRKGPEATEGLLNMLANHVGHSWMVSWVLARRRGPEVTEGLLRLLGPPLRLEPFVVLEIMARREGRDMDEGLLGLLANPDPWVRSETVQVLGRREGQGVSEALIGQIADDWCWEDAIRALGNRKGPEATQALLELLANPDPDKRRVAANALAARQEPAVTEALVGLLADPDPLVSSAAERALVHREWPGATELLLKLLAHPLGMMREVAASELATREGPDVTGALLRALADPDQDVRQLAAGGLAAREGPKVTEALLRLLADPEGAVRGKAVHALAARKGQLNTEILIGLLADPDSTVRHMVVQVLTAREGQHVTRALIGLLADPEPVVQKTAELALAAREGLDVTPALVDLLDNSAWDVQQAAARTLMARDGLHVPEQALIILLANPWPATRAAAAAKLASREGPKVVKTLLGLLNSREWVVREAAVQTLAHREDPEVTQALLSLLADPEPNVRTAAAGALSLRGMEVTAALLDLLAQPDTTMQAAASVMSESEEAQALLSRLKNAPRLSGFDRSQAADLAAWLMARDHQRIPPSEQPKIRAAMTSLIAVAMREGPV